MIDNDNELVELKMVKVNVTNFVGQNFMEWKSKHLSNYSEFTTSFFLVSIARNSENVDYKQN